MNQHSWLFTDFELTGISLGPHGYTPQGVVKAGHCEKCKKAYSPLDKTECRGEESNGED